MFGCHSQHQQKFRWLMYVNSVITVLSLTMLLWTHSPDRTYQLWPQSDPESSERQRQLRVHPTVPPHCGVGRIVPPGQKVVVNKTKTLMISAYQEHRTERREVRIIAVVLRSESVAYHCFLCCQDQLHVSEGFTTIHSDHFGFAYGTADIMCPIPPGCESPSYIALTSSASELQDQFYEEFMEVKNQKVKTDSFPYNFTVCLSTMFDFTNVLQLVQSLETMKLLGVNRVVVYRTSCSQETQRVLDYYTRKGLVEVVPWSFSGFMNVSRSWLPELYPGDLHYYGQIPALNDCIYRYMYRTKFIALHDMDELILPQTVYSWLEMIPLLEKIHGVDQAYAFQNFVFPNTLSLPVPTSDSLAPQTRCCPSWQFVPGVNILSHLYHEPDFSETFSNFKIIVSPRLVFTTSVHGILHPQICCAWVQSDVARMYHTRDPRQSDVTHDKLIYDGRLLIYSLNFTSSVNTVLVESGLLPKDGQH
ncbi:uncharacterized protein V6R79_008209 [Siganus canaliculatus]